MNELHTINSKESLSHYLYFSDCLQGNYVNSATGECKECEAGRYKEEAGRQTECLECEAGKFSAAGSATCSECEAGKFSAAGSATCSECEAGEFSAVGSSECFGKTLL